MLSKFLNPKDVLCSNTIGDKFIVEMQVDKEPGFTKEYARNNFRILK